MMHDVAVELGGVCLTCEEVSEEGSYLCDYCGPLEQALKRRGQEIRVRYDALAQDSYAQQCLLAGCLSVMGHEGAMIVDTGATKNVAGIQSAEDLQTCARKAGLGESRMDIEAKRQFSFGNGSSQPSLGTATIPCRPDEQIEDMDLHVLEAESPLLLGMPFLRQHKAILDTGDNPAIYFMAGSGKRRPLIELPTGHLALQVVPTPLNFLGTGSCIRRAPSDTSQLVDV